MALLGRKLSETKIQGLGLTCGEMMYDSARGTSSSIILCSVTFRGSFVVVGFSIVMHGGKDKHVARRRPLEGRLQFMRNLSGTKL